MMFLHQAKRELEMLIGLYRLAIAEINQAIADCDEDGDDASAYMIIADRDELESMLKSVVNELSIVKCLLNN